MVSRLKRWSSTLGLTKPLWGDADRSGWRRCLCVRPAPRASSCLFTRRSAMPRSSPTWPSASDRQPAKVASIGCAQAREMTLHALRGDVIAFSPPLVISEPASGFILERAERALYDTLAGVRQDVEPAGLDITAVDGGQAAQRSSKRGRTRERAVATDGPRIFSLGYAPPPAAWRDAARADLRRAQPSISSCSFGPTTTLPKRAAPDVA